MNLTRFEEFVSRRKDIISYKPDVPDDALLTRLVTIAQKTPSLLNLQPTRFVFVKNPAIKEKIITASWCRKEIRSAPLLIAFTADRNISIPSNSDDANSESMELLFSHKPIGFGWLFKAFCIPFIRLFSPTPELPAVHKRAWLYKEISMSAMHFMIAAEAAGLAWSVIDFFDEGRVKKALNLPRSHVVPLVIALGFPREIAADGPILPLSDVIIKLDS